MNIILGHPFSHYLVLDVSIVPIIGDEILVEQKNIMGEPVGNASFMVGNKYRLTGRFPVSVTVKGERVPCFEYQIQR